MLILPSIVLWLMSSAVLVAGLLVLYTLKQRHERAVNEFSDQVWQLTRGAGPHARLRQDAGPKALERLGSAINRLLEGLDQRGARLRDREHLFQRLLESVHDAFLVHRQGIVFANPRFLALLGATADEVAGKSLADFVAPDYVDLVDQNLRKRLCGESAAERYEVDLVGRAGRVTRVELASTVIDSGAPPALLLKALEMLPAAGAAVARPRAIVALDAMNESVLTADADGRIDYLNQSAAAMLGQSLEKVRGKSLPEIATLVDEADRRSLGDPVRKALTTGGRVAVSKRAVLVPANGAAERSVEISVSPLRNDGNAVAGVVIVLHDTSEMRGITRQMTYQASHDALTGLVNRREFERRLQEALDSAEAGDVTHALAYLDLDRFKVVNDTCGHTAGDSLLREVATLIKEAVRDSDTVARIGGDEFALLLVGCPLEKARQIADDVVRSVREYRFLWKDRIFNIGVSLGLVELGRGGGALGDLMSSADSACYVAKKQGGAQVHVYSAREEAGARHRGEIHWLQKLQGALRDDRFELLCQPIVKVRADDVRGPAWEVFVRLAGDHGQPGAPPAEFIRAAERHRMMPHVDRWVVQAVFSALGRGRLRVARGRSIAINIAGQTLRDPEFLEFVVNCFDHTGASPHDIAFEAAESSVAADIGHSRRFVEVLHGVGCEFALDDFGSGSSAFANLRSLPLDYVKIDGSLIRNLAVDSVNQAVVAATMEVSRRLNFRVIAEQVEEQASLDALKTLGIDFVQGFIVARPLPLPITRNLPRA